MLIQCENISKRIEGRQMPAGGHPSRWREIDLKDTTAGVLKDRAHIYRKKYEEGKLASQALPPPPGRGRV